MVDMANSNPEEPRGSYIEDIDLFDRELVLMTTKDLNNLMKRQNIPKRRRELIKQRRRTLKNRGYAAKSRIKLCDEEDALLEQIEEHEQETNSWAATAGQLELKCKQMQQFRLKSLLQLSMIVSSNTLCGTPVTGRK